MQRDTNPVASVDLLMSLRLIPDSPQQKRFAQWQGPPAPGTFGYFTSCIHPPKDMPKRWDGGVLPQSSRAP